MPVSHQSPNKCSCIIHVISYKCIALITHIFDADKIICSISNNEFSIIRLNPISGTASYALLKKPYTATVQLQTTAEVTLSEPLIENNHIENVFIVSPWQN